MISKIMIRNVATYDNVGVAVENLGTLVRLMTEKIVRNRKDTL